MVVDEKNRCNVLDDCSMVQVHCKRNQPDEALKQILRLKFVVHNLDALNSVKVAKLSIADAAATILFLHLLLDTSV